MSFKYDCAQHYAWIINFHTQYQQLWDNFSSVAFFGKTFLELKRESRPTEIKFQRENLNILRVSEKNSTDNTLSHHLPIHKNIHEGQDHISKNRTIQIQRMIVIRKRNFPSEKQDFHLCINCNERTVRLKCFLNINNIDKKELETKITTETFQWFSTQLNALLG